MARTFGAKHFCYFSPQKEKIIGYTAKPILKDPESNGFSAKWAK